MILSARVRSSSPLSLSELGRHVDSGKSFTICLKSFISVRVGPMLSNPTLYEIQDQINVLKTARRMRNSV
jgi:hypothetical protein